MADVSTKQHESDEDVLIAVTAYVMVKKNKKKDRRWAVHPLHKERQQKGAFFTLVQELEWDKKKFKRYFCCDKEDFRLLLHIFGEEIMKCHRSTHVISPAHRLAICLR